MTKSKTNKMQAPQKGFIIPILIIIAMVSIGGGIYIYSRNINFAGNDAAQTTPSTGIDALQTYAVNEYQFKYPSQWKPSVVSVQSTNQNQVVNFLDTSNNIVATLQCSIREVGYEAWTIISENREITTSSRKHGATLWTGTPKEGTGLYPLHIIFMYRNTFPDSWGNNADDYAHSCELRSTGTGDGVGEIFKSIYESVSYKQI